VQRGVPQILVSRTRKTTDMLPRSPATSTAAVNMIFSPSFPEDQTRHRDQYQKLECLAGRDDLVACVSCTALKHAPLVFD
jgi:hypothetical protein